MKIEVIKESDAPAAPKKQSKAAAELLEALGNLRNNQVLKLSPDEGKTVRGLRTGIGRITKGANVKITAWDDGSAVYVKKQ